MSIKTCAAIALLLWLPLKLTDSEPTPGSIYPPIAQTPPMGWNSWDSYGTAVRERDVKANADFMAERLLKYGWRYIVVDIQWYEPSASGHDYHPGSRLEMDEYGRLVPAVNRFPSASKSVGFKLLADYVHSKGLKFGIHILRGIPRQAVDQNTPIFNSKYRAADVADKENICRWNSDMYGVDLSKPGAQDYYDSIAALYAGWDVDFIKADDMSSPYHGDEIAALRRAIQKSGRERVLSLSPGPAPLDKADELARSAQMWRISGDFGDDWGLLRRQFDLTRDWAAHINKNFGGTWPDADMLPLGKLRITDKNGTGKSKFTADEQQTLITLWSIARSPLIFGGDLPSLDDATLALITNPDVIAVDQQSFGNHQAFERGEIRVWVALVTPINHRPYVAAFNLGETEQDVELKWTDLGLPAGSFSASDLWVRNRGIDRSDGIHVRLRPHASILYRVNNTGNFGSPGTGFRLPGGRD